MKIVKVTDKRVDIGTLNGLEFKCRRFIAKDEIGTLVFLTSGEA